MRQLVSPRFWATLAALGVLSGVLWATIGRHDSTALAKVVHPAPDEHRIDLLSLVYAVDADPGFAMVDGKAAGSMRLIIDGSRTMVITPGTPGSVTCTDLQSLARCAVAADLLGNAVVWFALEPGEPGPTIDLPGIADVRSDNWVLLANGWEVRRASLVERVCDEDTTGLNDFITRFADRARAVFDFDRQQVTKVVCPQATSSTTTTTTPDTTPATTPETVAVPVT